jgi:hypothetical protein
MYLYHILFTLINICGIDFKKKGFVKVPKVPLSLIALPAWSNTEDRHSWVASSSWRCARKGFGRRSICKILATGAHVSIDNA